MKVVATLQSPITKGELKNYGKFVKDYEDNERVVRCRNKNVLRKKAVISKEEFWRCLVIAMLTTQTKSGEHSPLHVFLKTKPNILNYNYVIGIEDKENIEREIPENVTRFWNKTCLYIREAISAFKQDFWCDVEKQLKSIESDTTLEKERAVADFIRKHFKGIGRKQSRNIIQMMGLSKYVLPIDSRVMKKIKELSGLSLKESLEKNYLLIEDRLQEICKSIGVYPCIFDACAFCSQETTKKED